MKMKYLFTTLKSTISIELLTMDETINHKFLLLVKILRLAIVCGSIFGLIFYVTESYEKLKVTPEVLVNEKFINSRAVPFPAVTVCSPQLIKRDYDTGFKLKDEVSRNLSMDDDDLIKMISLGSLCKEAFNNVMKVSKNMSYEFNEAQLLSKISPDIEDTLQMCVIEGFFECKNMIIRSLTDYGYCFSFNMLGYHSIFNEGISKDFDGYKRKNVTKFWDYLSPVKFHDDENKPEHSNWTLEGGYSTNLESVQPLRATRSQFFMTELRNDKNMTFCNSRGRTIYVILHLPNEVPTTIQEVHIYDLRTFNIININAEVKQHDKTLKNFDLTERGCFFEGEKPLRLFKSYTKFNCEYECMINFTYEQCGCVKFSMPRTDDMKVCKLNRINCYDTVARDWPKYYYKYPGMQQKHPDFPCDCMPSCTGINYNIMKKSSQNQKLQR